MKNFTHTLLLLLLSSTLIYGQAFITTWKTDNPGTSNDNQITIPTASGTYNYSVDWGDGNSDTGVTGSITHTYASVGTYTVSIAGNFPRIYFNNSGDAQKLVSIDQWGDIAWTSMASAFSGCTNMVGNATDIPDLSNVTNLSSMFRRAFKFNQDINNWNVSNITNMMSMFLAASTFNNSLSSWDMSNVTNTSEMFASTDDFNQDLTSWDVSNVLDMRAMFEDAVSFNGNISDWNVGKVTDMSSMFYNVSGFNQNINNWDVSSVTDMSSMFEDANAFNSDIGSWDINNVTNMSFMFFQATAFNQDISGWDVSSVTEMTNLFRFASSFNQSLDSWDVSNVTTMSYMFGGASSFNGEIASWDVSNVTNMEGMFNNARAFNKDIGAWDVSSVTNMLGMFNFAPGPNPSFNQDIGDWDVHNVTSMGFMFTNCNSFNQDLSDWDVSNVTNMTDMLSNIFLSTFNYDKLLTSWSTLTLQNNVSLGALGANFCNGSAGRDILTNTFNWTITDAGENCQPFITTWKTDNTGTSNDNQITIPTEGTGYNYSVDWGDGNSDTGVTGGITHTYASAGTYEISITGDFPRIHFDSFFDMLADAEKILSIEQWGDIEWASMEHAFSGCTNLVINATDAPNLSGVTSTKFMFGNASSINSDLNNWDVSNVTDMTAMFTGATTFNGDITNWDVSNVTTFASMFSSTDAFNQDISNWNVFGGENFNAMFSSADAFNININSWNMSNARILEAMFANTDLFNQPLNNWDVGNATTMNLMFVGAQAFNQPLGSWDVSKVTNMSSMFQSTPFNQNISDWDVSSVTRMNVMFRNNSVFNGDISSWNVENVTSMISMFRDAISFNGDISNWNVSSVTDMTNIFFGATSFNQDIGNWDVSNVTVMPLMFESAEAFNQDLSSWDVSSVTNMTQMFNNTSLSRANYDALLEAWSQLTLQSDVVFDAEGINYCDGAAARQSIIDDFNWTITDGGEQCINTETDILTFGFPDFEDSETIDPVNHTIDVLVSFLADPSSLVAEFTLSPGATSNPVSGTAQDFSTPFVYTITAEDGTTTQEWTVTVEVQNAEPEDITLDNSTINENNEIGDVIGTFSTVDGNLSDSHTYTLVEGEGDTFNQSFNISGNELIADEVFDFETESNYSVRVRTTDEGGLFFEKAFIITITDVTAVAQTISFEAIEDQFFEEGSLTLSATASSELEVSFELVSGLATLNGNAVSFTDLGMITIRATQAGSEAFLPADPVEQSFEVITVTNVEDELSALQFYPNPVESYLEVNIPSVENVQMSILAINGAELIQRKGQSQTIDLSSLKSGIYFLRVTSPTNSSIHKIVKR